MIDIVCDNCERTFEISEEHAGEKVPCPMCGDINRVSAAPSQAPASETRPAQPLDDREEQEICVVRPAMFRARPLRYLLIILLLAAGVALSIIATRKPDDAWYDWLSWPGLIIAAGAALWWVKWWIASHWWVRLSISNRRTVRHEGIIRRHSTEVLHDHVRSVDIKQKLLQRVTGVGYIGIDSAGQDGIEIEVEDMPRPYEIKKIIDQYRSM